MIYVFQTLNENTAGPKDSQELPVGKNISLLAV
jgi:hypothetical protein